MKKFFCTAVIIFIAAGISYSLAQTPASAPFSYSATQLENGLTVILAEDYSLPVVTVAVTYKTGSASDPPGQSGMAYLMENLMFQGSQNVGRLQHIRMINQIGGRLNALTTHDQTLYYETVPSNQLPLVLWLESDRMKSLSLSPSNVEKSKHALISEIRRHRNSQSFYESSTLFNRLLYPDFSYYHPVKGEESGIRNIGLESVNEFYSTYYRPNNAVLCVSGHFNPRPTMRLIRKYFANIRPGEKTPSSKSLTPPKPELITRVVTNTLVSTPGLHLGFPLTIPGSREFYTLVIIDYLLLRGQSSRLRKRLVQKDKTALQLEGGIEIRDNFSAYTIFLTSNNEATKEMSRKALFAELNKLKSSVVPEDELKKAKNLFMRRYYHQFSSPQNKALFLSDYYINHSGLDKLAGDLNNYLDISAVEIIRIMNRYFNENYIYVDIKTR